MQNSLVYYFYYIILFFSVSAMLCLCLKKPKIAFCFAGASILSGIAASVNIYLSTGHIPIFGNYETIIYITLVNTILALFHNSKVDLSSSNLGEIFAINTLLLISLPLRGFLLNPDFYMYENLFVIGFFHLRLLAIALFLFAGVNFLSVLQKRRTELNKNNLVIRGRNYLLLASVIYLCGEVSGSVWCFLWYGDPWQWSSGFFNASIMFLLSMVAFHLPSKIFGNLNKRIYYSAVPLIVAFLIYYLSQH